MSVFVESPWIGIALAIGLLLVAYSTYVSDRNIKRFVILVVCAALVLTGGILLDSCIETDREKISKLLDQIAVDLCKDDLDAIESHISPNAQDTRNLAAAAMALAKINKATVRNLQVTFNDSTVPPTAIAAFSGSFRGETKGGFYGKMEFFQRMTFDVTLEKIDGQWYVTDEFTYDPPIEGLPRRN